jgi:hypothetical protein
MINPFKDVNWNPDLREKRRFARSLVIGFPIFAVILLIIQWSVAEWSLLPLWIGAAGAGTGAILWLFPAVARPFYLLWFGLSCCIGIVVGNLLLASLFYLVITPIGLGLRLAGRGPISKGPDGTADTYWRKSEPVLDSDRYYRQF